MLSSYIKYLVTLDSFFYRTHVNLHFNPIRVLIPVGYTQPMTHMYQNPYPCVRVRVLTGTGTGCPEKPQGSPCHSLPLKNKEWINYRLTALEWKQVKLVHHCLQVRRPVTPVISIILFPSDNNIVCEACCQTAQ